MIDTRILVGLVAILITLSSVVYVGINEPDRQEEFRTTFAGRQVETGAAIFEEFCSPCHGIKGVGIPGVAPVLNSPEFFHNRLDELGYQGSLESYVRLTVAGGRPIQSNEGPWPQNMPTWSTEFGGPLRHDQIEAVTAYVLHWEVLYPEGGAVPTPEPLDCESDEECGELLFQNKGCIGCHTVNGEGGAVGPNLTDVYSTKGEDYIRQSVLNPNAVIAEGFQPNIMPQNFSELLSDEELGFIVSFLASAGQ